MRFAQESSGTGRVAWFGLLFAVVALAGVTAWDISSAPVLGVNWQLPLRERIYLILVLASLATVLILVWQRVRARADAGRHANRRRSVWHVPAHLPVASYSGPLGRGTGMTSVSPELERLLGYSRAQWLADPELPERIVSDDDRERIIAERSHHFESGERLRTEYRIRTRGGTTLWVREEAVVTPDDGAEIRFRHGVLFDITEQKDAEDALRHQALHDGLTELPNRTLLLDRLEQAIRGARRSGKQVALLLMDLDRFKEVNDTFGHQYGDLLLCQVVAHLRDALRESDTISRLGGDEFAVLLPAVDSRGAVQTVQKLLHVLRKPFEADGHVLDIGGSVGIAIYPDHGQDANTLLQRADVAMYAAKRLEVGYAVYEQEHDPHSPGRLSLVRELRHAIEHDELVLHYQPKANFQTGATEHLEALVRWNHPQRGFMAPDEFIATAEHAGLIKQLSVWVLNAALRQCQAWHSSGLNISIAVNLSPRTLHDPELVSIVENLLQKWRVEAHWLEVEITESALMEDPVGAMQTLTRLHGLGVCISIDDFGTGYSSLSYLTRLPADQIKIDKSFVLDMANNDDNAFIVRSVIDLGHNLSLEVVAEGVENQETWDLLASMGCDIAQGFHLSRPLPAADVASWLQQPRQLLAMA